MKENYSVFYKKNKRLKETALIVPNFNQKEITAKLIHLLKIQNSPNFDIIVVDNNSLDGSVDYLRKKFNNIIILANKENKGGASAEKLGMRWAYEKGYSYFILSDNDAFPTSKSLIKELVNKLKEKKSLGFVVPRNTLMEKEEVNKTEEIEAAPFHYFTIKRECIKKVGFPDTRYFSQVDDHEYSNRIYKANFRGLRLRYLTYTHPLKPLNYVNPSFIYYTLRNTFFLNKNSDKNLINFKTFLRTFFKSVFVLTLSEIIGEKAIEKAVKGAMIDCKRDCMGINKEIMKEKVEIKERIKGNYSLNMKAPEVYMSFIKKKELLIPLSEKEATIFKFNKTKRFFSIFYLLKNIIRITYWKI